MPSTLWRSLVWAAEACLLCSLFSSLFHLCKQVDVCSILYLTWEFAHTRSLPLWGSYNAGALLIHPLQCEVHTVSTWVHAKGWFIHVGTIDTSTQASIGPVLLYCVVTEWWVSCNRLNSDPLSSWQVWSSQQFFSSNLNCQLLSVSQYGIHLGMTSWRNQAGHCFPSTACRILYLIDYDCLVESSMLCISVGHLRLSGVRVEGLTLCFILI